MYEMGHHKIAVVESKDTAQSLSVRQHVVRIVSDRESQIESCHTALAHSSGAGRYRSQNVVAVEAEPDRLHLTSSLRSLTQLQPLNRGLYHRNDGRLAAVVFSAALSVLADPGGLGLGP